VKHSAIIITFGTQTYKIFTSFWNLMQKQFTNMQVSQDKYLNTEYNVTKITVVKILDRGKTRLTLTLTLTLNPTLNQALNLNLNATLNPVLIQLRERQRENRSINWSVSAQTYDIAPDFDVEVSKRSLELNITFLVSHFGYSTSINFNCLVASDRCTSKSCNVRKVSD